MNTKFWSGPVWVLLGGCILAFLNAAVNAGLFLSLGHSVAQMSGEISRMARDVGQPGVHGMGLSVLVAVACFLFGAVIAGYTIHHPTLDRSLPYGRCMMFIGGCLLAAHQAMDAIPLLTLAFAGFASGFQNAMATHYRGIILRTTHITGLLTDVGSHLGMLVHGHQIALWKIGVPAVVILFFFLGGAAGTWLYFYDQPYLLILATTYLVGGLSWYLVQRHVMRVK